jgi:hypothetical protein
MKKIFVLIALLSTFTVSSFADGPGLLATSNASANIITPITITKTVDLVFGNIAVNPLGSGGTVILAPSSSATRTPSAGITLPGVTGSPTAAYFTVTGQTNSTYAITLPSSTSIINSSNTMTINAFLNDIGLAGNLGSAGSQNFYVGGTLNLGAAQAPGLYTGSFDVTVNYN